MKKPYWKNKQFWICPKHLPSVRIPASIAACWYAGCTSRRPPPSADNGRIIPTRTIPKPKRNVKVTRSRSTTRAMPLKSSATTASANQVLCAWIECDKGPNGGRAFARKRSKYCSRDCSNRNARANYNARGTKPKET